MQKMKNLPISRKRVAIIAILGSIVCLLLGITIEEQMKKHGYGYSETAEITEFFFCNGPQHNGGITEPISSIADDQIGADIYLCGNLVTDGRPASSYVTVYYEAKQEPLYITPSHEDMVPGYFYISMNDYITSTGEYKAKLIYGRATIATATLKVYQH